MSQNNSPAGELCRNPDEVAEQVLRYAEIAGNESQVRTAINTMLMWLEAKANAILVGARVVWAADRSTVPEGLRLCASSPPHVKRAYLMRELLAVAGRFISDNQALQAAPLLMEIGALARDLELRPFEALVQDGADRRAERKRGSASSAATRQADAAKRYKDIQDRVERLERDDPERKKTAIIADVAAQFGVTTRTVRTAMSRRQKPT